MKTYTDQQIDKYLELAQEVGLGRAIRELGYPTYPTALRWAKARGITVNLDTLMANVKAYHTFYETEDMLVLVEQMAERVSEFAVSEIATADDAKKAAEATQKLVNSWLLLRGKATDITEKRAVDSADLALVDLLNAEKARNSLLEEDVS